jgi:hypothetical protein
MAYITLQIGEQDNPKLDDTSSPRFALFSLSIRISPRPDRVGDGTLRTLR